MPAKSPLRRVPILAAHGNEPRARLNKHELEHRPARSPVGRIDIGLKRHAIVASHNEALSYEPTFSSADAAG
jgi:hypothetical protein